MIKYIGSKRKLLKNIIDIAKDVNITEDSKILDAFSGSGNVSYVLATEFGSCDTCDLLKTSQCLNQLFLNDSLLPNLNYGNQYANDYFEKAERTEGYFYKTFAHLNKKPM